MLKILSFLLAFACFIPLSNAANSSCILPAVLSVNFEKIVLPFEAKINGLPVSEAKVRLEKVITSIKDFRRKYTDSISSCMLDSLEQKVNTLSSSIATGSSMSDTGSTACGPSEQFLSSDLTWTNPSTASALTFSATGDRGAAIKFLADNSTFPKGVILNVINGYGIGATLQKEIVISDCPHKFTALNNNSAYCRATGIQFMARNLYINTLYSSPQAYDCSLTAGQYYYINIRHHSTGTRGTVSVGLDIDQR